MSVSAQATFAATLADEWARGGVRHAVVSPGSRSTPLVVALAAQEGIDLHVHHDERSAAFTALGIGLATGMPAVVVTTSGTAAAELHPAVVEAHQALVPLIVCTADRPPELRQVGSPQTIDQTHLFGGAARWYVDPGVADWAGARSWRSVASRAVAEAVSSPPGPVHLNLPFREPLLGAPGSLPDGRPGGRPWHQVAGGEPAGPTPAAVADLASQLRSSRGVIVAGAGSGDADAVSALSAATGWPVLADPRSGCRLPGTEHVAAFDALLRHPPFAEASRPEVVVRLGEAPASRVLSEWMAASGARQVLIERHGRWLDPGRSAAAVVAGDPGAWCLALAEAVAGAGDGAGPDGGWSARWSQAEGAAQSAIEATLARHLEITEPAVARQVVRSLPDGAALVVASSMPIRDIEWYGCARDGITVLANRGANGIDGVVSTAVGVALAGAGPVTALVGDLAYLHDSNALLGLARRDLELTVVVVDNRGGGIFSFLPQAAELPAAAFELLFGTPHEVDVAALATVHGLPALQAHDQEGVAAALAAAHGTSGTHVVVARTDREANVAVHEEIHSAVAAAVDSVSMS